MKTDNNLFSTSQWLSEKLASIPANSRIFIGFNADADGSCSAVLFARLVHLLKREAEILFWPVQVYEYLFDGLAAEVARQRPSFVFLTDMPIHQELNRWEQIARNCDYCLTFDHHVSASSLAIPDNVRYVNPRLWSPSSDDAVSFLTFRVLLQNNDIDASLAWVAAIGLAGDNQLASHPEITESVMQSFPSLLENDGASKSAALFRLTRLINSGFRYKPDDRGLLPIELLMAAIRDADPQALKNPETSTLRRLNEIDTDLQESIEKEMSAALKDSNTSPGVMSFLSNSPHFIAGIVSSKLAAEFPGRVTIVGFRAGTRIQCELRVRSTGGFSLVDVLRSPSVRKYCLTCGGHPVAAGALIEAESWPAFVESLSLAIQVPG